MLADDLAQQQTNNDATFSLLFKQFAWQFQRLFFVAAKTFCSLTTQNIHFAVDQCRWHVDFVSADQTVDCLSFDAVTNSTFQLAFHVFTHFSTQTFNRTISHAETFDEFRGQFWQLTLFYFLQSNRELSRFTFQVFSMVIFREVHVDGEFFTGFVTHQTVFEAWDHAALAHSQYEIRSFAAFEFFTVDGTGEIYSHAVFSSGRSISFLPVRLLLTQSFQHGINISVVNFNNRFFNLDVFQIFQLNFRVHFKFYGEVKVFTLLVLTRDVVRCASWIDFFFDDRINEIALHQITQYVLTY
ncbi:hypothetical protein SRABI106_01961 [Rahnella aquatilis]|nr:hypothetical protein SRABI106_01961 [Rahnella aquatilis]